MSSKIKHIITSSIIALALLVILSFFLWFTFSLIVAVLVGLGTFWFFNSKDDGTNIPKSEKPELSITDLGNQALLMANLKLRKKTISAELRTNYEALIDQLIELLPLVNGTGIEAGLENELSWVINRMATEYLPNKSITPYLKLSEAERLDSGIVSEVLGNINAMQKELSEVKEMITQKNSSEFAQKAKFLNQRFTD